jgi:radical SAM superfamily enzyme YgiQ (UPF0313 family)
MSAAIGSTMALVALVGPEIEENLSLRYLASALDRAGHRAEIVPFNRPDDLALVIGAILGVSPRPAVVGLSLAFQWRAKDFLALALALREGGFEGHITLGGHFATFACQEILADFPEVDSVCRQEAEETIVALTNAVVAGADLACIAGLALRAHDGSVMLTTHPILPDLATLPWPDRRGEPARCFGHGIAPLVSSRGCYANCSFCCIAAWQEQSLPGKRYRVRDVESVADEMQALHEERGVDIFVFHDDNFFVPGHKKNFERFNALADALERRRLGRFATVVKARPTDVDPAVFEVLRRRLNALRIYVGIETDADEGLHTLRRWSRSKHNHTAIDLLRRLDVFACFNMLIFDPDTTLADLETNIDFMESAAEFSFNFCRVELYAGTPLLARMQAEGRCQGDYMEWDYSLASPEVERVFELSMRCFMERNFGSDALVNRLMATRFDLAVAHHFHRERMNGTWLDEGKVLTRTLGLDTARSLRRILAHVRAHEADAARDDAFVAEVSTALRAAERRVSADALDLARRLERAVGQGKPLTDIGDRVATPLQQWDVHV